MFVRFSALFFFACAVTTSVALADENPTIKGPPNATEAAFVKTMQADLGHRFATTAEATRAGYVRYTNPDSTGAISYANMHWQSSDVHHPSQLWYDRKGNLLGADYSVRKTSSARPHLWGIAPGRWYEFDEHVHFVAKNRKTGAPIYDQYVMPPKFSAAGGDPRNPSAATLVALHRVVSASDVKTIFDFPSVWDLIVWVKPNPEGAFAEKNPLVRP